jgi:hypothetical protein
MPPNKTIKRTTVKMARALENEFSKVIATFEDQACQLHSKCDKTYKEWLAHLKKQITQGTRQIKKLQGRMNKAKTDAVKKTISMHLKALQATQSELKKDLQVLSGQYKKWLGRVRYLMRFEKGYQRSATKKIKATKK